MSYSPEPEASGSLVDESEGQTAPPTDSDDVCEIPLSAASWTLSSAKPGNGIEQLLDGNNETFWQSDGAQPHTITAQFYRKRKVSDLWLQFNYKADESYTPQQLSVRIGSGYYDLQEVQVIDLREPNGWVRIPLALSRNEADRGIPRQESVSIRDKSFGGAFDYVRTFVIQIAIISNHQNGRDTHLRGLKLFTPKEHRSTTLCEINHNSGASERLDRMMPLMSPEMTSMALIR